jgi:acyl-CoA thioester hydrolase
MPSPHTSSILSINPKWIDYNGHLNMAYYHMLFDQALEEMAPIMGLGADYLSASNASAFTVEAHICYFREIKLTDSVQVTTRLIDFDEKRLRIYGELKHASEGWLAATSEFMILHVDMTTKSATPWPEIIFNKLKDIHRDHQTLPVAAFSGRAISMQPPQPNVAVTGASDAE